MILSSVPLMASAKEAFSDTEISISNSKQTAEEVAIVSEVQEKRDSNKKVFLLSDRSYMVAYYPKQVHYEDNGIWKDINNSLISSIDEDGSNVLENKGNSFKIKFANKAIYYLPVCKFCFPYEASLVA